MTQEEQQKVFEQALDNTWKDYVNRGAATVDALEENTQELTFAKGYNAGYKQALKHPTGGELLYVLNKGHKQGYKDAIDKFCRFIQSCEGHVVSDKKCNYDNFMKFMEEQ